MATPARDNAPTVKFRIDPGTHDMLMNSTPSPPAPPQPQGLALPEPIFPQYPERLHDPGPEVFPEKRSWNWERTYRTMRGWLFPYLRSRLLPGHFHPITAYLFVEYKCNLDCWYCWAFDNRVKGMSEDIARRSIDRLYDDGCRVLALMGGEPLLRPQFVHKVIYYAAKKGFWVYLATNGRLLRSEVTDRLGDAGVAVFNIAVDAWDVKPGLPKALVPIEKNLEYLLRKQYIYDAMVFFNMNICGNNHDDIRRLTDYAHDHRFATDYHINETPLLEQDDHFKHLLDNPTYIRPQDWRAVDQLIDWLIEKDNSGYQMVNSVQRLREMKAFVRMSSGLDLQQAGWYGDGSSNDGDIARLLASTPGIVRDGNGGLRFTDWDCRAGQNNVVIRTDGTVAPCFPMYPSTYDWGNIDNPRLNLAQLTSMKTACQRHCFSTLNHNLSYCYDAARVIKWVWKQARNRFQGGARSFDD